MLGLAWLKGQSSGRAWRASGAGRSLSPPAALGDRGSRDRALVVTAQRQPPGLLRRWVCVEALPRCP